MCIQNSRVLQVNNKQVNDKTYMSHTIPKIITTRVLRVCFSIFPYIFFAFLVSNIVCVGGVFQLLRNLSVCEKFEMRLGDGKTENIVEELKPKSMPIWV